MKCFRYLDKICTVGFEPNMMHKSRLEDLQKSYKNCGWNVSRRIEDQIFIRYSSLDTDH